MSMKFAVSIIGKGMVAKPNTQKVWMFDNDEAARSVIEVFKMSNPGQTFEVIQVDEHQVFAAIGGMFSEPPIVMTTGDRTKCEACGGELQANVKHVCHGNRRFHNEPELDAIELAAAARARGPEVEY